MDSGLSTSSSQVTTVTRVHGIPPCQIIAYILYPLTFLVKHWAVSILIIGKNHTKTKQKPQKVHISTTKEHMYNSHPNTASSSRNAYILHLVHKKDLICFHSRHDAFKTVRYLIVKKGCGSREPLPFGSQILFSTSLLFLNSIAQRAAVGQTAALLLPQ